MRREAPPIARKAHHATGSSSKTRQTADLLSSLFYRLSL